MRCDRLGLVFDAGMDSTMRNVLTEVVDRQALTFGISLTASAEADLVLVFKSVSPDLVGDEGFSLRPDGNKDQITIEASRLRGHIYALGHLFKKSGKIDNKVHFHPVEKVHKPAFSLRGHQLGYRNTANSWDAWTPRQFEDYILDLVLLGSNAIEDIPFQKSHQSIHMVMPHRHMHPIISTICKKYDIGYWVWTPGPGDLSIDEVAAKGWSQFDTFFQDIDHLSAVFFPGGDPGDNHPQHVFPYLDSVAKMSQDYFPSTKIWISLQGFDSSETAYFFDKIKSDAPHWFGGLVHGPSSPALSLERKILPEEYRIRLYGDITHTIRCQYPVPDWDQAFALTLGREPINPEPVRYRDVFVHYMPFTDGFLSYSDGVHDDVNKVVWNQMAWNPHSSVEEILGDYSRFFFPTTNPQKVAAGILSLEQNWKGPIEKNTAIEATFDLWQRLNSAHSENHENWRWMQLVFRAHYDVYVRRKAILDQSLETEVIAGLSQQKDNVLAAIEDAENLFSARAYPTSLNRLGDTILQLGAKLFDLVGLQTSVPMYQASNYERGSVLDFLDLPLNNQWWYEDQFDSIRAESDNRVRQDHLERIVTWSNPGPHAFYDNISSVSQSPHVTSKTDDAIDYAWWNNGRSRARLSSQLFQFSPTLTYQIPTGSRYMLRVAGYGQAFARVDGQRLESIDREESWEGFREFTIPEDLTNDGLLNVSFDRPDESHLNWREYSRISDVWLLPLDSLQLQN